MAGGTGGAGKYGKGGYGGYAGQPGQDANYNGATSNGGGGGGGAGGYAGGAGGSANGSQGGVGGQGGTNGGPAGSGSNAATVKAGNGYAGADGSNGGGGGGGGEGGYGLAVYNSNLLSSAFDNSGTVTGGDGGSGGAGAAGIGASGNTGGGGGGGGDATFALYFGATDAQLGNTGTLQGGAGGAGGKGGGGNSPGSGGAGGYGGAGVSTAENDTVLNSSTGKIYGGKGGAGAAAGDSRATPGAGGIGGSGVYVSTDGRVINEGSAKIVGGAGGSGFNRYGYSAGRGGYGVDFGGTGVGFTNQSTASVTGGRGGDGVGMISNGGGYYFSAAGGAGGIGVRFTGSTFQNLDTATITGGAGGNGSGTQDYHYRNAGGRGGTGVVVDGSGTRLTNNGSITGGAGGRPGGGRLTPGGLGGAGVVGKDLTVINTGSIAGGVYGGSRQNPGNADAITFTDGANKLGLGANASFTGALDIKAAGSTLTFDQSIASNLPVDATVSTRIIGAGAIFKVGSGLLTLKATSTFTGGTTIGAGTLDLAAKGAAGTGAITFTAAGNPALVLETAAQTINGRFANTLTNFNNAGETLDLKNFAFTGMTSYMPVEGNLTIQGGNNQSETFALGNGATAYTARSDGNNGTLIEAVCFAASTRIRTPRGDVAVEQLAVGDRVVTASGASRPVRWLGHRVIDCRGHARPRAVLPIRIAAGAFGAARPVRDLFVSPGHAICVDLLGEVLIPAGALVNGSTIAQVEVDAVAYWHVELDCHDILLAENLPAESYIDMGNRGFFEERAVLAAAPQVEAAPRAGRDDRRPLRVVASARPAWRASA